ncbi:Serine/threonine-protein kinase BRSK2-like [Homarus americanus]|uniref:non-specific serine/threonine protein kinase n=1 Tax=Homarus americanus TaxID=6706 RepID=A0A8J5JFQ9_HOMAM|nr:Serine/threonine-protein kinase BRSK2-like [Homarus americanus]
MLSIVVILYALLVGALPFDDDNLRQLLEKVKRGVFHIPHFVPPDCQDLLRGMIEVNPEKRFTGELELEKPMMEVVQTHIIPTKDSIDPDVIRNMASLGCFKDKDKVMLDLLDPWSSHTLPCSRRRSGNNNSGSHSPLHSNNVTPTASPLSSPRTSRHHHSQPHYHHHHSSTTSSTSTSGVSTVVSSTSSHQQSGTITSGDDSNPPSAPGSPYSAPYWKSRLNTIKNSFLGSPRFHRRKLQVPTDEVHLTPESSPELTKKSWFGSLMSTERDETYTILVKDKALATVKADLIHAFLSVAELSHSVTSPMSFRVEYKRGSTGPAMFQRHVRFQVDITPVCSPNDPNPLYAINFILLSGNIRRFRRICEHIQAQVCSRRPPASPRVGRKFTTELSESSSCGSDTSERLSPFPPGKQTESDVESDVSQSEGKNLSSGRGGTDSPQPNVSNGRSTSDPETQQLGSSELAT